MGVTRRRVWRYRGSSRTGLDKNLYDYYRVYAWGNLRYGIGGTGIWTYCAQGESPWSEGQRGIAYPRWDDSVDVAAVLRADWLLPAVAAWPAGSPPWGAAPSPSPGPG